MLPQFGQTGSAICFSSIAYDANLKNYKKFLKHIKILWENRIPLVAGETNRYMPWSISCDGFILYGYGIDNLIEGLKTIEIGAVTILLHGSFGEGYGYSKTFFVIISNYWKYGYFRDNTLDIYLSNIPLNFNWINEIINSLDILSPGCRKADSYSLKPYTYHFWTEAKKYDIREDLIGGIGRHGYNDDRKYDQFDGLILKNPFINSSFKYDDDISWNKSNLFFECPCNNFNEIVMSITNSPPFIKEIIEKSFTGFSRHNIEHMIFEGYGHNIHALLFWGWSIFK